MVFLFILNIIGYIRYAFTISTIFTYKDYPCLTLFSLIMSAVLDAVDGMAARKFNQCTDFGAVLDMVCDRASDAVTLAMLGALYPQYAIIFYGDILLDITSHWFQMYAALSSGQHHKKFQSRFSSLNLYYSSKPVLFTLCAGNGFFLFCSYVYYFHDILLYSSLTISLLRIGLIISGILFAIKKYMSIVQLISASEQIAKRDIQKRSKQA